jgi:polyhydroxyalkanoate synthase subunit PhaC
MNYIPYFQLIRKLADAYNNGLELNCYYNSIYFKTFHDVVKKGKGDSKLVDNTNAFYNTWLEIMDKELDNQLKSDHFKSLLSKNVNSLIEIHSLYRKIGYPVDHLYQMFKFYTWNFMFPSWLSKEAKLTPFDVIYIRERTRLLHYCNTKAEGNTKPLLIIYAPINRFHIMDLNPKRSVVRNLLSNGLDVYLLDLGYPGKESRNEYKLSLNNYISYVKDAISAIKIRLNDKKISLLGYCWGGILALIYTALNIDDVNSLTLITTPVDFSKDNTILANWSNAINIDKMMDEFGEMNGQFLDLLFIMRNPPRFLFDRYLKLYKKFHDIEFVNTFIDIERWLYDTPPIPGDLHRQIINNCYKNNLLILNKMEIVGEEIDLGKVTIPLLMIDAEKDDLVSKDSALAVSSYVSSKEKESITYYGGNVELCISDVAHNKLWPGVAKWILSN